MKLLKTTLWILCFCVVLPASNKHTEADDSPSTDKEREEGVRKLDRKFSFCGSKTETDDSENLLPYHVYNFIGRNKKCVTILTDENGKFAGRISQTDTVNKDCNEYTTVMGSQLGYEGTQENLKFIPVETDDTDLSWIPAP